MRGTQVARILTALFAAALMALLAACGGGSTTHTTPPPAISVSITQGATTTANDGASITLNAQVTNDTANAGVTWTVSGTGALSGASATSVTYTAPATGTGTDTVTATSVTDHTKSASIMVSYSPAAVISVTIASKFTQIQAGSAAVAVTATVQNDVGSAGVTWSLTSGGSNCSPACGALTGNTTTSVTYTPPATVPGTPTATITATSVADTTKSDSEAFTIVNTVASACAALPTGHESLLNGNYTFLLRGFEGANAGTPVVYAASFVADGTGKITGGELDMNDTVTPQHVTLDTTNSSYKVGLDSTSSGNLGCLTLAKTGGGTVTLAFALGAINAGVAGKGRIIEFDDAAGTGTRAAGRMLLQTTSSFNLTHLQPHYAFGMDGWDMNSSHFALGGSFTANTTGNLTNLFADADDGGTLASGLSGGTGTINAISTTTGRATGSVTVGGQTFDFAIYMINTNEFFIIGTDPATSGPVAAGRAIATFGSFNALSLLGNYIVGVTGSSGGSASVALGLLSLNVGAASGTLYTFDTTNMLQSQAISGGTFSIASPSGRVTFTGVGSNPPIIYLTTPQDGVAGFIIGTDGSASFGTLDPQPNGTYSLTSVTGTHDFGDVEPADNSSPNSIGVVSVDSSGNITGTEEVSDQQGLTTNRAVTGTITVNANGTGDVGTGTFVVTNGTELYFLNGTDAEIFLVEQ